MDIVNAASEKQTIETKDVLCASIPLPPTVKTRKASIKSGLIALIICFLAGVLCGTLLWIYYPPLSETEALTDILLQYSTLRKGTDIAKIFISSFSGTAAVIAVCFFCGTSYLASPLLAVIPFFKGAGYGLAFAYLYSQSGGVKTVIVYLLLPAVLSAFAVILASAEGIRMSRSVFGAMYGYPEKKSISFGIYILRFILSAAVAATAAGADALTAVISNNAINI